MTETNLSKKCYWCKNEAEGADYRCIDEMNIKILSCKKCFYISTKRLLEIKYENDKT